MRQPRQQMPGANKFGTIARPRFHFDKVARAAPLLPCRHMHELPGHPADVRGLVDEDVMHFAGFN